MSAWLLAALLPATIADDVQWLAWEGIARKPHTQHVLYAEQHWLRTAAGQPLERVVLYRCPGGAVFARKHVDYRPSRIAPVFTLDDARSGYREGLAYDPDGSAYVFFRESADAAGERSIVSAAGLVADAGFDEFIRANWNPLIAGITQTLAFAVPARGTSYRFTARRINNPRSDDTLVTFQLRLQGLLKWLAPPIQVSYRRDTRQLAQFRGLANLRDEQGEQMQAWIDFPEPATPSSARAAANASALALARCTGDGLLSESEQRPLADTPARGAL